MGKVTLPDLPESLLEAAQVESFTDRSEARIAGLRDTTQPLHARPISRAQWTRILPMDVITYSLRNGQARSDQYYRDVATFTDKVLAEAEDRIRSLVEAFQSHLHANSRPVSRTDAECAFELLTLGVLWQVYAGDALGLAEAPRRVMTSLAHLRQRGGLFKSGADLLRGALAALFLLSDNRRRDGAPTPTLDCLGRLLNWLEATGNFEQESKRLRVWQAFLASRPAEESSDALATILALAAWFEARSEAALGCYTPQVEQFLTQVHRRYRWREDAIFCGRRRVEYHLNMVGTEILDRVFRQDFLRTGRRVVVVPPCMRAQPDDKCQARSTSLGDRCAGCTPGCRVHQLTQLGDKLGFAVLILPEDLRVFAAGEMSAMKEDKAGLVGISCVLTNAPGGWETQDLGLPAQGVLLDYCGCRYHWHRDGIATDINIDHLLQVLGTSRNKGQEAL